MVSSVGSSGTRSLQNLAEMQSKMFGKLDKNSSGGLDVDEFSAMVANAPKGAPQIDDAASTFTSFDANGDGSLSQNELDSGMKSLTSSSQSTVERFGGGSPPGPPPASDGGSSDDDVLKKLLSALASSDDGGNSSSSSSSSSGTASSSSTSADAQEMAKKLSRMLEQMSQAFASIGGQASSGLSRPEAGAVHIPLKSCE